MCTRGPSAIFESRTAINTARETSTQFSGPLAELLRHMASGSSKDTPPPRVLSATVTGESLPVNALWRRLL